MTNAEQTKAAFSRLREFQQECTMGEGRLYDQQKFAADLKVLLTAKAMTTLVPPEFDRLFNAGWVITRCSCVCDGSYAWMKKLPNGAYEMHGCVCHNTPRI